MLIFRSQFVSALNVKSHNQHHLLLHSILGDGRQGHGLDFIWTSQVHFWEGHSRLYLIPTPSGLKQFVHSQHHQLSLSKSSEQSSPSLAYQKPLLPQMAQDCQPRI